MIFRNLTILLACSLTGLIAQAEEWPQFRGPTGQGHSTAETVPLHWASDSENIVWRTKVEGLGWSSPAILDGKIWLTTADDEGLSLRVICLDGDSGKSLHNVEVFKREEPLKIHNKNSHASPSALLQGDRVYVHFGTYGTACLNTEGEVLWRRQMKYKHVHGPGGSPTLFEDLLIFSCDGGDVQFVVALDKKTGEIRWQTERPENPAGRKFAFCTPLVIDVDGKPQLVSPGAGGVSSYNPRTGEQLWRVDYPGGYSVVPRPVYGEGLVFVSSSYDRPTLYAIRPDGRGNVTETHVAWTLTKGAPHNPSPVLVDGALYVVSDRGVATCVDAASGEVHWQERVGGNYSSSLTYGAERIYFLDEAGKCTVVAANHEKFQPLAKNDLAARTLATPAIVGDNLYLRTESELLKIRPQ